MSAKKEPIPQRTRFGRWTTGQVTYTDSKPTVQKVECICDCGHVGVVTASSLKKGTSTSCGCFREQLKSEKSIAYTHETFKAHLSAPTDTGCLEWQKSKNNKGYGTVHYKSGTVTAHRLAAFFGGLVDNPTAPKNLKASGFILHQCDNPACCNVQHFKIGTYGTNQKEAYARGGRSQPKGPNHTNSKLTDEQAQEIRRLYATGEWRQVDLAEKYWVSQANISQLILNRKYKT